MSKGEKHRRKYPRYTVTGVHGKFAASTDVEIVDLSLTGAGIETRSHLGVGRDYRLRIQQEGRPLELVGRVVWSALVRTERDPKGDVIPVYRAGIRFREVLGGPGEEWMAFLGERAVVHPERRLVGRFLIDAPAEGRIHRELAFEVDCLSLGGMLVFAERLDKPEALVDERLRLSMDLEGDSFATTGEVIYLRDDEERPERVGLGVRFVDLDEEQRRRLESFVERHADLRHEADPAGGS